MFEYNEEEIPEIIEEFYPNVNGSNTQQVNTANHNSATITPARINAKAKPSLKDKLNSKVAVSH